MSGSRGRGEDFLPSTSSGCPPVTVCAHNRPVTPQELRDLTAAIEAGLIARSENGDYPAYKQHRKALLDEPALAEHIPGFVKLSPDLDIAFGHMRRHASGSGSWERRRQYVRDNFRALHEAIDRMESTGTLLVSDRIEEISVESAQRQFSRALALVEQDPASALTKAATALADVCKHILDTDGVSYSSTVDLPPLIRLTARTHLNLEAELGIPAFSGINNQAAFIAEVRNRHGDAHPLPEPVPEVAEHAVVTASSLAIMLLKHWQRQRNTR